MRHTTLRRMAAAGFGIALLATALTAAPASAAPAGAARTGSVVASTPVPGGFASWAELLRVQEKMNAAAARVSTGAGFAGVVADPTSKQLRVYWKGRAPAGLIAAARAFVPVTVHSAAYSQKELSAAAARLVAKAGSEITSVGPRADGSGLVAGTQHGLASAASYAGVPVTVETGVSAEPASRVDDSPPWWGGGRWQSVGGSCSTGFAVVHGGVNRMLSAAHCANNGNVATDPTGQVIGTVMNKNSGTDTLIIAGNSAGRVFNNSTNAAGGVVSEFSNPVVGRVASQVGNFVCTTGSFSGTRCSIQVVAINQCINVLGIGVVCGQVRAEQTAHTNGGGNGDSGGAVEIVNSANTSQVFATGTLTAIDKTNTQVPCTGYVLDTPTRSCAWRIYYEDIFGGMNGVGATAIVLG
ncbi:chymotrypsin family serine protease [Phytohabitans aurantiacus]|jgi:hypothetical protein|nr:hypothetical protein [Phytohabitans aurantiacus]